MVAFVFFGAVKLLFLDGVRLGGALLTIIQ